MRDNNRNISIIKYKCWSVCLSGPSMEVIITRKLKQYRHWAYQGGLKRILGRWSYMSNTLCTPMKLF